ncbi:hypothetical protein [Methanofollis formosanus]|uniref:hypothetical protein n=1 Tax=Methanofollis formosanus TaxID=299308 RepID=UPI001C7DD487|nr:hypothetical protein [Methanofollis formosanus]
MEESILDPSPCGREIQPEILYACRPCLSSSRDDLGSFAHGARRQERFCDGGGTSDHHAFHPSIVERALFPEPTGLR